MFKNVQPCPRRIDLLNAGDVGVTPLVKALYLAVVRPCFGGRSAAETAAGSEQRGHLHALGVVRATCLHGTLNLKLQGT